MMVGGGLIFRDEYIGASEREGAWLAAHPVRTLRRAWNGARGEGARAMTEAE
jgi:hypothetical protein